MGAWLYAKHDEGAGETIVFRADFDAVRSGECVRHVCGHDGHTASLLGLALLLENRTLGRNIILLFQHAEETGVGGFECERLFELEKADAVIGCHNIPLRPLGTVLLKSGTFACASCGYEINMKGKPTHAAYPENGINPARSLAKLAMYVEDAARDISKRHSCMTLATVVGMRVGDEAYGVAASEGSVFVTLRSEKSEALDELVRVTGEAAERLSIEAGLEYSIKVHDPFPATVNNIKLLFEAEEVLKKEKLPYIYLEEPFRWSEDFGHYTKFAPALFIGIGSGEHTAPLHTEGYEYPDELAPITAELFIRLAENISLKRG